MKTASRRSAAFGQAMGRALRSGVTVCRSATRLVWPCTILLQVPNNFATSGPGLLGTHHRCSRHSLKLAMASAGDEVWRLGVFPVLSGNTPLA
jgi:hypothetical protein